MPIDFRKSAIVATTPSVPRLAHTIKRRTYICSPPSASVNRLGNGGTNIPTYSIFDRSLPAQCSRSQCENAGVGGQDEASIAESAGCARAFLPALFEKLSMA